MINTRPRQWQLRADASTCVALCLTWLVCAQSSPDLSASEIEHLKSRLSDPALRGAQRLAVIDELLRERARIIESNPNAPDRAAWLADQASDLYFEWLSHEAAGTATLFGSPPLQAAEGVRGAVEAMYSAATQAEGAVEHAIRSVESAADFQTDTDLQQRRRHLVEVERDRRIPFLRGVAAALHAELNLQETIESRRQFQIAAQLLSPLLETLDGRLSIVASLHLGFARSRLDAFDAAEALFAQAARDERASELDIYIARMLGVMNRTQRSGPAAGLEALASFEPNYSGGGASHFFYRLLIADHRNRLAQQSAMNATGDELQQIIQDGLQGYMNLWRNEQAVPRELLQSILLERLSRAVTIDVDLNRNWSGLAAIALAGKFAQKADERAQAIALLESSIARGRLEPELVPAAHFMLARLLYEHEQPAFAARRFLELAANYRTDLQAPRAIELGVTIAADLHRHSPDDREARTLLREGLDLLLQRYPNLPSVDRWRLVAAQLALEEERLDQAGELLGHMTPNADEWVDAQVMQVAVQRRRAATTAEGSQHHHQHEQIIALIDRAYAAIQHKKQTDVNEQRKTVLNTYLHMLQIYRAEALIRLNQAAKAIELLEDIEGESGASSAVRAQVMNVRIEAYQQLKQPQNAIRELQHFIQASPQQAGDVLISMLTESQREVDMLLKQGRNDRAHAILQTLLVPAAELLDEWVQSPEGVAASMQKRSLAMLRIADAFRHAERFAEALSRYEELLQNRPDAADYLFGKAECLYGLGTEQQLGQAMEIYKRLAAVGADSNSPHHYWMSQLRMLQILDRVNRSTEQIIPRIERLRQQDREFGGERFRKQFESLRQKHTARN